MEQPKTESIFSGESLVLRSVPNLCFMCMITLHIAQVLVPAPSRLPDLYEVLWSVAGCGMFSIAWLATIFKLYFSATTITKARPSAVLKEIATIVRPSTTGDVKEKDD